MLPCAQCHSFILLCYLVLLCASWQKDSVLPPTANSYCGRLCAKQNNQEMQEVFANKYPVQNHLLNIVFKAWLRNSAKPGLSQTLISQGPHQSGCSKSW
ncbi:hypothetical protein GDO78_006278 [Eleutherodactylus coqui]|uniref:Secreted protein n=1 Tax=Eleutherodactylus coqui TaxID=57060 RepID=A0A8J6FMV9_ELECQ|nr:hypothetical protein GDO78_006278 [Eleutherodactylus coqui]